MKSLETKKEIRARIKKDRASLPAEMRQAFSDRIFKAVIGPVSYTHLDVYKRQIVDKSLCFNLTLAALDKVRTRRMLNQKKEISLTEKFIKDLGIKSAGMHNPVKS